MKVSRFSKTLTGKHAKDFLRCSNFAPTPLSLQTFLSFGKNAKASDSFLFLRKELLVRLANIMQEIQLLPDKLHSTQPVNLVVALYEKSFCELLDYESANATDKTVASFTDCLAQVRERHANVVETMAQGVMELKDIYGIEPSMDNQLQYFLDRFYLNRISIRMLINQHVTLFGPELNHNKFIGMINEKTNVVEVIADAFSNAAQLCSHHYGTAPGLRITIVDEITGKQNTAKIAKANDYKCIQCNNWSEIEESIKKNVIDITYVPAHLHHICFEVMKNAMRAVAEHHSTSDSLPDIKVLVCGGRESITIKVFDRGGGIPRSLIDYVFRYTFTTATSTGRSLVSSNTGASSDQSQIPMAGYGYGLPLSRLYARYFNGDLTLSSIEGFGTDAVLYLMRSPEEADELLPIFNKTSARQYGASGIPIADWSNPDYNSRLYTTTPKTPSSNS